MGKLTMTRFLIILRYILCLVGAAALLCAFSYPDTLIPPDPAAEDTEGISLYTLKPVVWLLPVLYMELVSSMGPHRNRVWFCSLLAVLVVALVAYPLLETYRPEYVTPTFSYQGGMLSTGLIYYISFIGVSLVLRLVLLTYMFPPEELQEQLEIGFVSASVLDPAQARTIKEIAAEGNPHAHKFHFKEADNRMVLRFKLLMRRMMLRSRMTTACIGAGVVLILLWFALFPRPTAEEALQRDLKTMLQYRVTANGYPLATRAAVHAAARVMKHISDYESFAGMRPEDAEAWLKLDMVPEPQRAWMRDNRAIKLDSTDSTYEIRTRFLTITDGTHFCVLYVRTNNADGSIVISEFQEAGWDAVADEARRKLGNDWNALYR